MSLVKGMKMVISLLLLGMCQLTAASSKSSLPTITFELQSQSPGDLRDVMVQVLETARQHLTSEFVDYYSREEEGYFDQLDLSINSFDTKTGVRRRMQNQVMTISYNGEATFHKDPPPEKDTIETLTTSAFKGNARIEFIEALLASDVPFLADLSYLVVGIDGVVVANEDLSHRVSQTNSQENNKRQYYLIGAVAGAAIGVLIACGILIWTCKLKREEHFPDSTDNDQTMSDKEDVDLELKSTKSPSPERSFVSQESSKFTYNPRNWGDTTQTLDTQTLPSNISGLQVEVSNASGVNVEAWQKSNTISPITPAPFGADISAIELEKKDLSVVEEGPSTEERSSGYLSKGSLRYLDHSSRSGSACPTATTTKKTQNTFCQSSTDDESGNDFSLNDDGSDVIRDLKNLSVQIQKRRAGNR